MSRIEKILYRLKSKPGDFTWAELELVMRHFGYTVVSGSGSRRKFFHPETHAVISLHKPHPKPVIKMYMINLILDHLLEEGYL